MAILDFSVSGWHGFGSVTQVCFGISVSNFMCMSFVAVGRSLTIVSYVAFKMAALWFWTMFNCNPSIAHYHPLLWGGGILVDHWSTISSLIWHYTSFYLSEGPISLEPMFVIHRIVLVIARFICNNETKHGIGITRSKFFINVPWIGLVRIIEILYIVCIVVTNVLNDLTIFTNFALGNCKSW